MTKRSRGWAVVREQAPVMPWEEGTMDHRLADALTRVAAVRGTAYVARFYINCIELQDRLKQAQGDGIGEPLTKEEAEPIIRQHYYELVEFHGVDHAQAFVNLWLMISGFLERVEKGWLARRATRLTLDRVRRA